MQLLLTDTQISYSLSFSQELLIYHNLFTYHYFYQVECQNVAEALEAGSAGADIIMLDNFTHETIGAAAAIVKKAYPHILIEASGVSLRYLDPLCQINVTCCAEDSAAYEELKLILLKLINMQSFTIGYQ